MMPLTETEWQILAVFVSDPLVSEMLIQRAMETPYFHLDGYMNRYSLFNPTPAKNDGKGREYETLPSVRIHHILRGDEDRHPHNHPWDARSIILRGWYTEQRDDGLHMRKAGDTFEINHDTFHHIESVSPGGVMTMFISGDWKHVWGFRTADGVVDWRTYLGIPAGAEE